MNIKNRISKLESNVKPKLPGSEWNMSVLSVEELRRLDHLLGKNENEITSAENEEIMNLCERCRVGVTG